MAYSELQKYLEAEYSRHGLQLLKDLKLFLVLIFMEEDDMFFFFQKDYMISLF